MSIVRSEQVEHQIALTFASLFTGGGLADVGAMAAGYKLLWGVEYDPAIAAVANANLPHADQVYAESVVGFDWATLERPDHLHMSPPCQDFSVAKSTGKVSNDNDALAQACVDAIKALQPSTVTLENVEGYRKATGFQAIVDALWGLGYWVNVDVLNSADFGGEILCPIHASFAGRNYHREIALDIVKSAAMMQPADQAYHLAWDAVASWVRAMSQDSAANATWQKMFNLAQPSELEEKLTRCGKAVELLTSMVTSKSGSTENTKESIELSLSRFLEESSIRGRWFTISTETKRITVQTILKSLGVTPITCEGITQKTGQGACPLCRNNAVPQTRRRLILRAVKGGFPGPLPEPVRPWKGWYQAIEDLIPTLPETQFAPWQLNRLPEEFTAHCFIEDQNLIRHATFRPAEPVPTVTTGALRRPSSSPKAFLVDGIANDKGETVTVVNGTSPAYTVKASSGKQASRAYIGESSESREEFEYQERLRWAEEDRANSPTPSGRVVRMTPRALARFQTVPDWYILPEKTAFACKIIGNGVPCLMMQRIMETF